MYCVLCCVLLNMKYGEVMMRINEKTFGNFIGELFGAEQRLSSPESGNIVVLYEDDEIKDITATKYTDVIFGMNAEDRDIPSGFTCKNNPMRKYKYRVPISNSYGDRVTMRNEKYKNVKLEPSRFNTIFDKGPMVFESGRKESVVFDKSGREEPVVFDKSGREGPMVFDKSEIVFSLMRIRSSDTMPRFLISYDETQLNKVQTEQIIHRILCA